MKQEEKAKAYDMAIERAKKWLNAPNVGKIPTFANRVIEEIFPELKEDEDEMVRKELIAEVKERIDCIPAPDCRDKEDEKALKQLNKWLAFLEKQGEQNPAEFDDTNAKRMFIKALERVEEQNSKGYKLTDCDKNSWWEDFKAYTSCTVEQKPAWSEDGWTMQDEEELQIALDTLVKAGQHSSAKWLKNVCLRPQNTWKPSDEQMFDLRSVVTELKHSDSAYQETIEDLYQDLKKLKGE